MEKALDENHDGHRAGQQNQQEDRPSALQD
jgi:hypothetical protein